MRKKTTRKQVKKYPLTYAIADFCEQEIREYVNSVNRATGLPINRIVSNLLLDAVRRAKNFYSSNSENSEKVKTERTYHEKN